jgi:hypothetical protein
VGICDFSMEGCGWDTVGLNVKSQTFAASYVAKVRRSNSNPGVLCGMDKRRKVK